MQKAPLRDLIAFWIFGLANNYAYVIMLSAAADVIANDGEKDGDASNMSNGVRNVSTCEEKITERNCSEMSTGAILIADILPCLIVKIIAPFFMHRLPFGLRHAMVCLSHAFSFIIVAFSGSIELSLVGIALASAGSGFGESCYLALAAYYPKSTISLWSSGTGGAGIAGSFAYAALTEPSLIGLKPRDALLSMLIIPAIFAFAYWFVLTPSPSVHRLKIFSPKTWIVPKQSLLAFRNEFHNQPKGLPLNKSDCIAIIEVYSRNGGMTTLQNSLNEVKKDSLFSKSSSSISAKSSKFLWITPLLKYMIPLGVVYFAEYLINQGIVEFLVFDCSHGFSLSKSSQYRWYQVLYQVGVFISRSSVGCLELSAMALYFMPFLQMTNLVLFLLNVIYSFIPHIALIFAFILFEGFFGGASYVNTFNRIHKEAPTEAREFCLSIATLSDSVGTLMAGVAAFPLHKFICSTSL